MGQRSRRSSQPSQSAVETGCISVSSPFAGGVEVCCSSEVGTIGAFSAENLSFQFRLCDALIAACFPRQKVPHIGARTLCLLLRVLSADNQLTLLKKLGYLKEFSQVGVGRASLQSCWGHYSRVSCREPSVLIWKSLWYLFQYL